jgi:hypothetical protein
MGRGWQKVEVCLLTVEIDWSLGCLAADRHSHIIRLLISYTTLGDMPTPTWLPLGQAAGQVIADP